MEVFKIKKTHLKLIRGMCVDFNDCAYFGSPQVNIKRPYGNGDVLKDIGRILEIEPEDEYDGEKEFSEQQQEHFLKLHRETATAIQIIFYFGEFKKGKFQRENAWSDWEKSK